MITTGVGGLSQIRRNRASVGISVADPNPDVCIGSPGSGSRSISKGYGSGSFYHHAINCRKTLIPTVLRLLFDFLSLKNDVSVASKCNKQKNFEKK